MHLSKTLTEADETRIITTREVQTQVVITESLPPRAGLVGYEDMISTSDIVKTYFVTYTYYNTYLEANNSTLVRVNVSTSSDVVTEKISFYPKKTTPPSLETQAEYINEDESLVESSVIDDIHIYTPKTYLTTFTFFTTLVTDSKQSTVVNSHTKVVENVVTETMSAHLLPSDIISDIRKGLLTQDGVTTVVNIDKQPIAITAVNLIKKISESPEDAEDNEIEESENNYETVSYDQPIEDEENEEESVNEEEHEVDESVEEPVKNVQNTPANKLSVPPISSFISSLGFSPFSNALGPVINAMAGLIQNKWGRNATKVNKHQNKVVVPHHHIRHPNIHHPNIHNPNIHHPNIHHPNIHRPVAEFNDEYQNRSPLYIPLSEDGTYPAETHVSYNELNSQNPFNPHAEKWVSEEDQRKNIEVVISKPSVETPLMNGGIQISPGQIITANSDVIVGKPGVIGPRLPFVGQPSNEIPIGMQPPPLPSAAASSDFHFIHNSIQNQHQSTPHSDLDLKFIDNNKKYQHSSHNAPLSIKLHNNNYQSSQTSLSQNQGNHRQSPHNKHQFLQEHPLHQYHPQQIPLNDIRGPPPPNKNHFHTLPSTPLTSQQMKNHLPVENRYANAPKIPEEINNHQQEIIEIQRVPEVYSTDLPPVNINMYPALQSSMRDSLLVNIQPSQVANVVIPHGSTTALIFGGSIQPHTNGKYFDDPLSYPDVKVYHDDPIKDVHAYIEDSVHVHTYHPHSNTIFGIAPTNAQTYSDVSPPKTLIGSSSFNNFDEPVHYKSEKTLVEMKIPHNSNSINVQLSPNPIIVPSNNPDNHQRHQIPVFNQIHQTTQRAYVPKPLHPVQLNHKNINDNIEKFIETASTNFVSSNNNTLFVSDTDDDLDDDDDTMIDGHRQDDVENEDGEVIQESNTLPLRPGQVPPTSSDATTTSTTVTQAAEYVTNGIYDSTSHPQNLNENVCISYFNAI